MLKDGQDVGVDLTGGWYDGEFDHVVAIHNDKLVLRFGGAESGILISLAINRVLEMCHTP
jgi:hypothetical protein